MRRVVSLGKKASEGWTVKEIVTIVLALFVIALVAIGLIGGTLIPLKDKLSGWFDNVLSYFGWGQQATTSGQLRVEVPGVGYGNMTLAGKECKIDMDGGKGSYALRSDDFSNLYVYENYYQVTMAPGGGHAQQILYFRFSSVFNYWQWSARKVYWAFVDVTHYNNGGSDIYTANDRFQKEYLSELKGKDRVSGDVFFKGKIATQDARSKVEMFADWTNINQEVGTVYEETANRQSEKIIFNLIKEYSEKINLDFTGDFGGKLDGGNYEIGFTDSGVVVSISDNIDTKKKTSLLAGYYFYDGTSIYYSKDMKSSRVVIKPESMTSEQSKLKSAIENSFSKSINFEGNTFDFLAEKSGGIVIFYAESDKGDKYGVNSYLENNIWRLDFWKYDKTKGWKRFDRSNPDNSYLYDLDYKAKYVVDKEQANKIKLIKDFLDKKCR